MANYNRYKGSDYPNSNREEDRGRYSRRDYNKYENDYGDSDDYGQRRDTNSTSNWNSNMNRPYRRYDEDYDDYMKRNGNYGNRSQGSNYGNSYGSSQYNRDYDTDRYGTNYGNTGSGNYGYGGEYNRNRGSSYYNDNFNDDSGTSSYGYGGRYDRNRDQRQGDRDWWDKTKDEVSSWFGDDEAERRRRMDKQMGAHRGRGPKGYTRSDERIREDINDRLSDDSFLDASEIEVSVSDGDVILTGTVITRIDKRRAEDLAEDISGVKNVQNQLRVKQTTTTETSGLKNEYQG